MLKECFDCPELEAGDGERVEWCWWVRIRGTANKADLVVGVCYRPPSWDEEMGEIFYRQLGEVSHSLALVLMGTRVFKAKTLIHLPRMISSSK